MIDKVIRRLDFTWLSRRVRPFASAASQFRNFDEHFDACIRNLRPDYDDYVARVSRADMAASLELGASLCAVCQSRNPKRVLDFGSGFSSFVLRTYAKSRMDVTAFSVDDDAEWLEKTARYLESHRLETTNLLTLQNFLQSGQSGFDLILHDLNFVEVRIRYVEAVIERLAPGGLIIFDDVHKRDYLHALLKLLHCKPGTCYSLKPVTMDHFGRYALAYFAPPA
jgi:predicted O-methyltransferase YrrM